MKTGDENFERHLLAEIQDQLRRYKSLELDPALARHEETRWERTMRETRDRLIDPVDGLINAEALRNFRKLQLLVKDRPRVDYSKWWTLGNAFKGHWCGERMGERLMLIEELEALKEAGFSDALLKYPANEVGNPILFKHDGYQFTFRWVHHAYYLGLFKQVMGNRIGSGTIVLDIGSSYGIFPYLFLREFPGSHAVLVDYPEQLILAHYFLAMSYPESRIAGIAEASSQRHITREWLDQYDFALVPCAAYERLSEQSVDLVANFSSFSEMPLTWCRRYWESVPFRSAKYLFVVSRIQSYPEYQPTVSVIDFPIQNGAKRLHFAYHRMFVSRYVQRRHFWFKKVKREPMFEYIGEI